MNIKKTPDSIQTTLIEESTSYGFVRQDGFIGALNSIIADIFSQAYNENIYLTDANKRLTDADVQTLNSWAQLFKVDNQSFPVIEITDLSLLRIETENNKSISDYTESGNAILIPSGTTIFDADGNPIMAVSENVSMDSSTRYIQAIGLGGVYAIEAGTYYLDGEISDFGSVIGSTVNGQFIQMDTPRLLVILSSRVSIDATTLPVSDYRSLVITRAQTLGLSNSNKIELIKDDRRIARLVVKEFQSGASSVSIFVEPVNNIIYNNLLTLIEIRVKAMLPKGTRVKVSEMIGSIFESDITVSLNSQANMANIETYKEEINTLVVKYMDSLGSGTVFYKEQLGNYIKTNHSLVDKTLINTVNINGKKLAGNDYRMQDIEYLYSTIKSNKVSFA